MKRILLYIFLSFLIACKGQTQDQSEGVTVTFKYLSDEELQTKSKEELRFIRNEIFARKGYVFKSDDLNEYFSNKVWYKPNPNLKISLSNQETNFINKIKELEEGLKKNRDSNIQKSISCIDLIDNEVTIYPINLAATEDHKFYEKIEKAEIDMFENEKIKDISCEGITYNIKCFSKISYLFIPTAQCGNDETFLALIKGGKTEIKNIQGALSRYERLDYVLTKDWLEVITTDYYQYEADQRRDEGKIKKTSIRYKLTETGLVEL